MPKLAWHSDSAFSSIASNTGARSPGEELMTCNTSAVAVCCSKAPRVLHCDDRLRREVLQQSDLFFGERAHLLAEGRYCAEQTSIFAQRHYEKGACATKLGSGDAQPIA